MDDLATAARGPFESGPVTSQPGPVAAGERDARYDNQPPLEERVVMDFMEDLERPGEHGEKGIKARIEELLSSASRAPETCDDETTAGKMSDLCKQAREISQRLETARDKHNRPLLNAQRSLKGRADGLIAPLSNAIAGIRQRLDDFARREDARRAEEQRKADEARRVAEEAARAALAEKGMSDAIPEDQPIFSAPEPAPAAPLARGNYGSKLGTQTVWKHEIESVRQLPDRILKHPKVIEALDKVIGAEIRGGVRAIKGVRIWDEKKAAVR